MEIYSVEKNSKSKKIIILSLIVIVLIIIAAIMFFLLKKEKVDENKFASVSDEEKNFSIMIPIDESFSKVQSTYYDLVLRSDISGSSIYFSKVSNENIRDVDKFIEYDKNDYISKFSNISEVSEISKLKIQNFDAYNYNFKYKDTMYVDVYWIVTDSYLYIVDFDINTSVNDLTPYVEDIISSLQFN